MKAYSGILCIPRFDPLVELWKRWNGRGRKWQCKRTTRKWKVNGTWQSVTPHSSVNEISRRLQAVAWIRNLLSNGSSCILLQFYQNVRRALNERDGVSQIPLESWEDGRRSLNCCCKVCICTGVRELAWVSKKEITASQRSFKCSRELTKAGATNMS